MTHAHHQRYDIEIRALGTLGRVHRTAHRPRFRASAPARRAVSPCSQHTRDEHCERLHEDGKSAHTASDSALAVFCAWSTRTLPVGSALVAAVRRAPVAAGPLWSSAAIALHVRVALAEENPRICWPFGAASSSVVNDHLASASSCKIHRKSCPRGQRRRLRGEGGWPFSAKCQRARLGPLSRGPP